MAKKDKTFTEMIEDMYGSDVIEVDEDFSKVEKITSIPTGSVSLDISTGVNGIPLGRITTIYGPESSAKTSLCLSITKQAIKSGYKVLYVDQEQTVDHNYIRALVGEFDSSKLVLTQPETAEQSLFICESGIKSGEFNLIILDSVGALAPEKEKEDDYGKAHVAIISRELAAFLRRNAFDIRKNNVAFIFVNQVRATIGTYVSGFDMPGGHALRHFSSMIILLYKGQQIEQGDNNIIGSYSRFTIKKNKLSIPFKSFTFPLIYGKGIETERDLLDFAEMLGIVSKRGSYYVFEGETIAQGLLKSIEVLKSNTELLDKIVKKVYNNAMSINKKGEVDESLIESRENL